MNHDIPTLKCHCCVDCICLPACISKGTKELVVECSIIEYWIRDKANDINLHKMLPILFYGLDRTIFIDIDDKHVFVLKHYKSQAWVCIDRTGGIMY